MSSKQGPKLKAGPLKRTKSGEKSAADSKEAPQRDKKPGVKVGSASAGPSSPVQSPPLPKRPPPGARQSSSWSNLYGYFGGVKEEPASPEQSTSTPQHQQREQADDSDIQVVGEYPNLGGDPNATFAESQSDHSETDEGDQQEDQQDQEQAAGGDNNDDRHSGSEESDPEQHPQDNAEDDFDMEDMANRLQALEQALADARAANPAAQKSITVPPFEEATASLSAELWISNLDRQKTSIGCTDPQMLNAALCALKGKAGTWREGLELNKAVETTDFTRFRSSFLKRFGKDRSATDLIGLLRDVQQKKEEGVRDFSDRLGVSLQTLANNLILSLPDNPPAGQDKPSRDAGFTLAFTHLRGLYFVSGIKEALRTRVEPRYNEFTSYDKMVEVTCEIERTLASEASGSKKQVASVDINQKLDLALKELAAFKTFSKQSTSGNQRGQQQSQGGNSDEKAKRKAFVKLAKKVQKKNTWRFCNRCKTWGKHIAPECRVPQAELSAIQAQDQECEPPGPPIDKFWDYVQIPTPQPQQQQQQSSQQSSGGPWSSGNSQWGTQ